MLSICKLLELLVIKPITTSIWNSKLHRNTGVTANWKS